MSAYIVLNKSIRHSPFITLDLGKAVTELDEDILHMVLELVVLQSGHQAVYNVSHELQRLARSSLLGNKNAILR